MNVKSLVISLVVLAVAGTNVFASDGSYQAAYGEVPNQFAADAYDCIYAVYQAFTATGLGTDASTEDICDAMCKQFNTMSFSGLTGQNMTWSAGQVDKAPAAVVIKDGVYVSAG